MLKLFKHIFTSIFGEVLLIKLIYFYLLEIDYYNINKGDGYHTYIHFDVALLFSWNSTNSQIVFEWNDIYMVIKTIQYKL